MKRWMWVLLLIPWVALSCFLKAYGIQGSSATATIPDHEPPPVSSRTITNDRLTVSSMTSTLYQSSEYINPVRPKYNPKIVFMGRHNKPVGSLSWPEGGLVFKGNAQRSANIFFYGYLKPMVDDYIDSRLRSGGDGSCK